MNTITLRVLSIGVGALFWSFIMGAPTSSENKLQRLFHHRVADTGSVIELGQIAFYFSCNPQVTELKSPKKDEKLFFIPHVFVDKSLDAQIDRFNKLDTKHYKAQLAKANGGITLRLSFDADKVGLDWGNFVTIKNEAGFACRFYDNEYLKKLNKKRDGLLKVVSHSKKGEKPCIIVDCGHGGSDWGAVGYNKLIEKEVTLDVGTYLAQLLRSSGSDVFLTRTDDRTIPIDERTSFANKLQADLLISIHANATTNTAASGVETFCLPDHQYDLSGCSLSGTSKNIADMVTLLRARSSFDLACAIQNNMVNRAHKAQIFVVDRSVKRAWTQMLAGSFMPAVLVEIGFLTNKTDAGSLSKKEYRHDIIAQAICQGALDYWAHLA